MKDERGKENVSLLYSVACAQTICTCLNGHTPLLTRSFMYLHVFVCIVTTTLASCIISCLSSLYCCDNDCDNITDNTTINTMCDDE